MCAYRGVSVFQLAAGPYKMLAQVVRNKSAATWPPWDFPRLIKIKHELIWKANKCHSRLNWGAILDTTDFSTLQTMNNRWLGRRYKRPPRFWLSSPITLVTQSCPLLSKKVHIWGSGNMDNIFHNFEAQHSAFSGYTNPCWIGALKSQITYIRVPAQWMLLEWPPESGMHVKRACRELQWRQTARTNGRAGYDLGLLWDGQPQIRKNQNTDRQYLYLVCG